MTHEQEIKNIAWAITCAASSLFGDEVEMQDDDHDTQFEWNEFVGFFLCAVYFRH